MLILQRPPREGKTTDLIRLMRATGGVLIVATRARADQLVKQRRLKPEEVLTWNEATQVRKMLNAPKLPAFIDDVDQILRTIMFDRPVAAATVETSLWQEMAV